MVKVYVVLADGGTDGDIPSGTSADCGTCEVLGVYTHYADAATRVVRAVEAAIDEFGMEDAVGMGLEDDIALMRDRRRHWNDRLTAADTIFEVLVGEEQGGIAIVEQELT